MNTSFPRERAAGSGFLSTAALLAACTLLSRVLGLLRDAVTAWLLGAGPMADVLVAAMRLPHLFRRMLADGSLSMTLTTGLVRGEGGRSGGAALTLRQAAHALGLRLALALLLLCLVLGLASVPLMGLLAPGLGAAAREQAATLLCCCLPYVFTAGLAGLGMAVLHGLGRFCVPALSPVLFNLTFLAVALGALVYRPDSWIVALLLASAMSLGGCAQWALQDWAARRTLQAPDGAGRAEAASGGSAAVSGPWRLLARVPLGVLGATAPQLAMLAAMLPASLCGDGEVSALYYAERLLELPLGLVGVCLGMASLPHLSTLVRDRNEEDFHRLLAEALRWSLRCCLPAMVGLMVIAETLVGALFGHGAFQDHAVGAASLALCAYACCLPACAMSRTLLAGCHALGLQRAAALTTLPVLVLTLAVGGILIHSLPEARQGWMAAAAASAALCVQTWLLWRLLCRASRAHVGEEPSWLGAGFCGMQLLGALAAGGAAWGVQELCAALPVACCLLLAVVGGGLAWGGTLLLLGDADLWRLADRLRRFCPGTGWKTGRRKP